MWILILNKSIINISINYLNIIFCLRCSNEFDLLWFGYVCNNYKFVVNIIKIVLIKVNKLNERYKNMK